MCPAFHVTPEHEARELLNIALLLERCLALPDITAEERAAWEIALDETRRRLEDRLAPARQSALLTRRLAAKAGATLSRA
jgi:hypothetical protein